MNATMINSDLNEHLTNMSSMMSTLSIARPVTMKSGEWLEVDTDANVDRYGANEWLVEALAIELEDVDVAHVEVEEDNDKDYTEEILVTTIEAEKSMSILSKYLQQAP